MYILSNQLVLILTVRRTGFDSQGRNLEICNLQIPSKSWSIGPWLRVSLKHFMQHFTLPPTGGFRWCVTIVLDGRSGLDILTTASGRSFRYDFLSTTVDRALPRLVGYPGYWLLLGKPDVYHAASYPVRKDSRCWWNPEITYLQISTPEIEPGASNG